MTVLVELLYVADCPNYRPLLAHLGDLLTRAGVHEPVRLVEVEGPERARTLRFLGSPTLRVDGRDVDPSAASRIDYGLQCRVHPTADGLRGSPPDDWVLDAVADAAGGR
ncbi:thioredoxin family protein [Parafrankia sp. FMc6]|uniref:DF family (seleno)protein n=1 Tax=Parafrankia soli TaxID=2599596 RepID=UPI0034D44AF9